MTFSIMPLNRTIRNRSLSIITPDDVVILNANVLSAIVLIVLAPRVVLDGWCGLNQGTPTEREEGSVRTASLLKIACFVKEKKMFSV